MDGLRIKGTERVRGFRVSQVVGGDPIRCSSLYQGRAGAEAAQGSVQPSILEHSNLLGGNVMG